MSLKETQNWLSKLGKDYSLRELNNLTDLVLFNKQITDLTPLKELKSIAYLNLGNNQIKDLSPLKRLNNIILLSLYDNQIKNISSLKELKYIERLHLDGNIITDARPLKDLEYLFEAWIAENGVIVLDGEDTEYLDHLRIEYKVIPNNSINRKLYR